MAEPRYLGPLTFEGKVDETAVEALFAAPNTGDRLGVLTVRELFYVPEGRNSTKIELPDSEFVAQSIEQRLTRRNSIDLPGQDWDRMEEYHNRVDLLGALHGITEAAIGLPAATHVRFEQGTMNIWTLSPGSPQRTELIEARLQVTAWEQSLQ